MALITKVMQNQITSAIPPVFFSDLTDEPINHCCICDCELLLSGKDYVIEKAIHTYPNSTIKSTIFEYALCVDCAIKFRTKLSKESLQKIEQFGPNILDFEERANHLMQKYGLDYHGWLQKCTISGESIENIEDYQIMAQCHGDRMIYGAFPQMISSKELEFVSDLISVQTKEELDNFKDGLYTGPPELEEIFKGTPVLV